MSQAVDAPEKPSVSLTNPPGRLPVAPDFPRTITIRNRQKIYAALEAELAKYDTSLADVGHITVAYPHKHPELFPGHFDTADEVVSRFMGTVQWVDDGAGVEWRRADGIVDTLHLDRSGHQSSLHALMAHQVYDIHLPSQAMPLPFLEGKGEEREFFVIVDKHVMQGTTVTTLKDFIEHNGGTVLAVAALDEDKAIAPEKEQYEGGGPLPDWLSDEFRTAAEAKITKIPARLDRLADVLSSSALKEEYRLTPAQCMDLLDEALRKHNHRVAALTDGECAKIIHEFVFFKKSFTEFFAERGVDLPPKNGGGNTPRKAPAPRMTP